jgi:hypothetical protein
MGTRSTTKTRITGATIGFAAHAGKMWSVAEKESANRRNTLNG